MYHYSQHEIEQLAERVSQYIDTEDTYLRERIEAFEVKRQFWLIEEIKMALRNIYGWIDESLVEPIMKILLRRGMQ